MLNAIATFNVEEGAIYDAKKEAAAYFSFKNLPISKEGATVPSICFSLDETSAVWEFDDVGLSSLPVTQMIKKDHSYIWSWDWRWRIKTILFCSFERGPSILLYTRGVLGTI